VTAGTREQGRGVGETSAHAVFYLAWSLWVLSGVLVALGVLLLALNRSIVDTDGFFLLYTSTVVAALTFSTIGALVASRRLRNPIGWLFSASGLLYSATSFVHQYSIHALVTDPDLLPGGLVAAWLTSWLYIPPGILVLFLFLLFPDGRLPSPRWRSAAWLAALVFCLWIASYALAPGQLQLGPVFPRLGNPFGVEGAAGLFDLINSSLSTPLWVLAAVIPIGALFVRFRQARGVERQQIKWVVYAASMLIAAIVVVSLWPALDGSMVGGALFLVGFLAIPTAMGVAIFRYRLYDIDILINRTLVYGALTASLALVYVGSVALLQGVLRALTAQESQLAIVASTLAVAALFNPLRRRIQSFIDRRFYRRKYDAAKTLEAFSAKLREETDLDALSDDLVGVVRETMQPSHLSLWLRPDPPPKGKQAD
jgi:hypothetical protein